MSWETSFIAPRCNRSVSLCLFQKIAAVSDTSSEESGRFKSVVLLAGNETLESLLAFLVVQTDPVSKQNFADLRETPSFLLRNLD